MGQETFISTPEIDLFFTRYVPKTEIEKLYGSSIFSFLRNLHAVLHRGCKNLYSREGGSPCLHTLSSTYCCRLFDDSHCDWCEMISLCIFDLHYMIIKDVEHISCASWLSVYILCRNLNVYFLDQISNWHLSELICIFKSLAIDGRKKKENHLQFHYFSQLLIINLVCSTQWVSSYSISEKLFVKYWQF